MNAIKGKQNAPPPSSLLSELVLGLPSWKVRVCAGFLPLRRPHLKRRCAALCPLLTPSEPYLDSPLNSPSDILFIKSFHILLCPSLSTFCCSQKFKVLCASSAAPPRTYGAIMRAWMPARLGWASGGRLARRRRGFELINSTSEKRT